MSVQEEMKQGMCKASADTLQDVKTHCDLEVTGLPASCVTVETQCEVSDKSVEMSQEKNKSTLRRRRRPWITEEFMQMIEQRDKLHSKWKKDPDNVNLKKQFSVFRNQTAALRKKLKLAYQMFLEDL